MQSDWEEIKRLAADFQKAQLSSSLQRLSERNCIELVTLLIEKGLLDVIYTVDGKEYLTPDQLRREIEDELYVNGGRVNLVELSKSINVDFQKISVIAEKIVEEDPEISLILGQLISTDYITRTASEINEKLIQAGEINVSDLTVSYDLPSDFLLNNIIEKNLGKLIFGKQDANNPRFIYTEAYIIRCKSKIRGALAAITKPTPISAILSQSGVLERIFFSLINENSMQGTMTSRSVAGQYIPHIYTRTQSEWVKNFYKQNGYLEYESVSGLGVSDPKGFIQKQLPGEKIKHLVKCAVGQRIIDQVDSTLEESIATGTYLDVSSILPSVISEEDIEQLIKIVLVPSKQRATQLFGSIIFTTKYIDGLLKPVYELADQNASKSVESGQYLKYVAERQTKHQDLDIDPNEGKADKREERRKKAAGGKAGGGTQGRETKTKSTKKAYRAKGKEESDSDEENVPANKKKGKEITLNLISVNEIKKIVAKILENDGFEDLAQTIAEYYHLQLSKYALNKAQELQQNSLQNNLQNRKQNHASLQDKLNNILNDIRLYEKGLKVFPTETQTQLVKYLLKSLGTDVCNELALYIATECNLNYTTNQLSTEQRNKIAQECDQEYKAVLGALNKNVNGASIEEFLTAAENTLQSCSMILKKIDKKKDKQIILTHKHGLLEQLYSCNDPALVLHLAVLVIFTINTQCMLHASGKFVGAILGYLRPSLTDEQNRQLIEFHDLVMKLLTSNQDEKPEDVIDKLNQLMPTIKDLASNYKKSGVTTREE